MSCSSSTIRTAGICGFQWCEGGADSAHAALTMGTEHPGSNPLRLERHQKLRGTLGDPDVQPRGADRLPIRLTRLSRVGRYPHVSPAIEGCEPIRREPASDP